MMDREISAKKRRDKRNKLYIKLGIILSAAIVFMVVLVGMLSPKLKMSDIETSTVEAGSLDVSVGAVGSVVPYYEEVISSPISSKILDVYKHSGEEITAGEAILELDLTQANVDMKADRVNMDIMKRRLDLNKAKSKREVNDMRMQIEIERMQLERMAVLLSNERYLDSIGASTKDQVRQNEMNYEIAQMKFGQMETKLAELELTTEADIMTQDMEFETALDKMMLKEKQIGDARVTAPRDGTLSWVNEQIGANVGTGEKLAILSDLSRFKVNAEVSENYAGRLTVGNKAEVKIGNKRLTGVVTNVVPAVEDGRIKFTVNIDQADDESLRSGLKVDVYVVHSIKDDVLRIANRSYYSGPGSYDLWVVDGGTAQKRTVELGESSSTLVEVLEGLGPGEVVVVSNMTRHKEKTKLRIK